MIMLVNTVVLPPTFQNGKAGKEKKKCEVNTRKMEQQRSARPQGIKKEKEKEMWKDAKVPRLAMQTYSRSETDMPETDLTWFCYS